MDYYLMIHNIYPGHLLVTNWLVKISEAYINSLFCTHGTEAHIVCTLEVLGLSCC